VARQALAHDFRSIDPGSARIVLLEGAPYLLGSFPDPLRRAARRSLERLAVEVLTSSMVTFVGGEGVTWRSIGGDGTSVEHHLPAHTVLWAAGVAASPLAESLGAPLDRVGRVIAEPTLALPGHPDVFVVGDVCAFQQDGHWLPGVAQVAKQQGAHAALNVRRRLTGAPPLAFTYRDYGSMATIGRGAAIAHVGPVRTSGFVAWLIWLFIHILWLVGFRNRLVVLGEWAWSYVTLQRRVRLITGGAGLWPRRDH
jgi:NADH dehydrogenase